MPHASVTMIYGNEEGIFAHSAFITARTYCQYFKSIATITIKCHLTITTEKRVFIFRVWADKEAK